MTRLQYYSLYWIFSHDLNPSIDVVRCVNTMYFIYSVHESRTWTTSILLIFNLFQKLLLRNSLHIAYMG